MALEYLEKTLVTCIKHHETKGNSKKVKQLKAKLKIVKEDCLNTKCD